MDFFHQESFFEKVILGNTVLRYLVSFGIFLGPAAVIFFLNKFVVLKIKAWAEKTAWEFDDFAVEVYEKIIYPLIYMGIFFAAFNNLNVAVQYKAFANKAGLIIATIFIIRSLIMLINFLMGRFLLKGDTDEARVKYARYNGADKGCYLGSWRRAYT